MKLGINSENLQQIGYCFIKLGISSEKLAAKLGIVS
jgi:hypothetical protein